MHPRRWPAAIPIAQMLTDGYTQWQYVNMDLVDYIADRTRAGELTKALGVHRSLLAQWRSGARRPGPLMARRIEAATGGQVKAETIRPDVFGPLDGS